MNPTTFDELYTQLQELYHDEEYLAALELATQAVDQFPEQRTVLDYWRMTLSARTGNPAQALTILQAALDSGCWYSELLLRRSPSLKSLQGSPEFEDLIAHNQAAAEQDQQTHFPLFTLRPQGKCQSGGPPCPLLIGLHTNGGNVQSSLEFWKPAATNGWLVAAPQSSQAIWKGSYVWDDREVAEAEVKKHFLTLTERYAVDTRRSILAGHSLGGELAIYMTLNGSVKSRRFLAIGPAGPFIDDLNEWEPLLHENPIQGVQGYIITGELDSTISHTNINNLVAVFNQVGIPTRLETIPDAAHDYTPAFDEAILRALRFLK
jgi:predicted esterase